MGKRKRASDQGVPESPSPAPQAEGGGEVTPETAGRAHLSPDALAGSPDVFAPSPAAEPEAAAPPSAPEAAEPPPAASEAEAPPASEAPPAPVPEAAPAPAAPAPLAAAVAVAPRPAPPAQRKPGSMTLALGVVLVVVGIFALGVAVAGVDLTQYGWPLFVIIPGLTLLVVGFLGAGAGASIPGGLVTMFGLVLAYQTGTGDWASWAFAWTVIAPFGVGLGMYLQALRDRDGVALRRGRTLLFTGALLFMFGFVFFESILNISGRDYGVFGKAAVPLLLIVVGIVLLVRNARRRQKT